MYMKAVVHWELEVGSAASEENVAVSARAAAEARTSRCEVRAMAVCPVHGAAPRLWCECFGFASRGQKCEAG